MQFTPIPALADKTSTSMLDALPHFVGMITVMVTLTILWGVCALTAKLVARFLPEPSAPAAPMAKPAAKPVGTSQPGTPAGVTPEIVAVIAAAVATTTGQARRIISIKPMSTSWEKAGRQSVLTSHRIR